MHVYLAVLNGFMTCTLPRDDINQDYCCNPHFKSVRQKHLLLKGIEHKPWLHLGFTRVVDLDVKVLLLNQSSSPPALFLPNFSQMTFTHF